MIMPVAKMLKHTYGHAARILLQKLFRFDKWHTATYESRPYAKTVVEILNSLHQRGNVVEIGCGLGDILRRLAFKNKLGLDQDKRILRAAKMLGIFDNIGNGKITFQQYMFPSEELPGMFDAVVMVNWIHHLSPEILKRAVDNIFLKNLKTHGILVLDVVANKSYQFNHDWKFLTEKLNCAIRLVGPFEYGRQLVFIEKREY